MMKKFELSLYFRNLGVIATKTYYSVIHVKMIYISCFLQFSKISRKVLEWKEIMLNRKKIDVSDFSSTVTIGTETFRDF